MLNVNETVTSIKPCYKIRYLSLKIWRYAESPYLCNVFFIVLDLRLTKSVILLFSSYRELSIKFQYAY